MTQRTRPVQILLIEDSPADIDLTLESLAEARVANRVHTVMDGEAALDFLFRRGPYIDAPQPDLILLDLNLPRKDGREVLAEIKAHRDLKHIPVLVLTSSNSERDVLASYRLQANSYITKPIGLQAFQQLMKALEYYWLESAALPQKSADAGIPWPPPKR